MSQPHHKLVAWQRADDLCFLIYTLTAQLPREERFGLTSQLRRAAYSVPANIVEGFAYEATAMRLKHLRIAVGSLAEVGYGIHFSHRFGYFSDAQVADIEHALRNTAAPLHGLIAHCKRELTSQQHGPRG